MESKIAVASTNNGRSNWEYLNLAIQNIAFNTPFGTDEIFVLNNVCYILGDNQVLYKNKNMGSNWDSIWFQLFPFQMIPK